MIGTFNPESLYVFIENSLRSKIAVNKLASRIELEDRDCKVHHLALER
jgi:hypothetical protein